MGALNVCSCVSDAAYNSRGSGRKYPPLDTTHPVALLLTEPLKLLCCLLQFHQTPLIFLLQFPHLRDKTTLFYFQDVIVGTNEDDGTDSRKMSECIRVRLNLRLPELNSLTLPPQINVLIKFFADSLLCCCVGYVQLSNRINSCRPGLSAI